MSTNEKPTLPYWHLWVDEQGVSHQTRCQMTEFEMKSISGGAAAQWQGNKTRAEMTVEFTVLPVGWKGAWHPNPKPQWIVPLSGRWFVESMDGQRVEMGQGEVSFGEDQGSRERDGKSGHASGTVGDEPAVLMLVQFETPASVASPCRFK
ncbi:MAG: cupin domain-containing protein [Acetobacteraceae bacterium]|nr:cupin domain-containing protein [Acetobacteraceae bacterium]